MKKIIFFLFILLFPYCLNAQTLHFAPSCDSAFIQAKEQGKMVFVYAYSPCRMCDDMYEKVMSLPDISSFLNEMFVLVDMDMDEREGVLFKRKYNLSICPSFLIFDSKRTLQHKIVGICPGEEFLTKIGHALDVNNNYHNVISRYEKGERSLDLLPSYLVSMSDAGELKDMSVIADDFFAHFSLDELSSQKGWLLFEMCVNDYRNPVFQSFVNNKEKFVAKIGSAPVNNKIRSVVMAGFENYLTDTLTVHNVEFLRNAILHAGEPENQILSDLLTYKEKGDYEAIMKEFEEKVFHVEPLFRFALGELLNPLMMEKGKEYHSRISDYIIKCLVDIRARRSHAK